MPSPIVHGANVHGLGNVRRHVAQGIQLPNANYKSVQDICLREPVAWTRFSVRCCCGELAVMTVYNAG